MRELGLDRVALPVDLEDRVRKVFARVALPVDRPLADPEALGARSAR